VLVLGVVNGMIWQKERVLARGEVALLPLAPVDPRSLIQGDYMSLRYDLRAASELQSDGLVVIRLGADRVATVDRVYRTGEPLAPGEHLLRARYRHHQLRLGAEAFYFQEGQATLYAEARYGELRVAPDGESVLVGLRDKERQRLGTPR
jgi:uncharacterized membrane-anchored protein